MNTFLKIMLWCMAIGLIYAYRPNQNSAQAMTLNDLIKHIDTAATQYRAVSGRDTAILYITQKGTAITGNLRFTFANGNTTTGLLKGTLKGDTLLGDYLFKTEQGIWYRNPLAFLQRGNQLTMGIGQMEFAWGRGYFKKNEPIDYDKGRFVFATAVPTLAAN